MEFEPFKHWVGALNKEKDRPAYLMIADLIASDIDSGILKARDRLPTLRVLAKALLLDYTTVARGYKEARQRGLIDSHPGSGSFVKGKTNALPLRGGSDIEMTMNLPPEPTLPALLTRIRDGLQEVMEEDAIYPLLRYQDFGGTPDDKEAALEFLNPMIEQSKPEQVLVCPGIHSALVALLSMLANQGSTICVQGLVYPGLKAIASQLGVTLTAIDSDSDGPIIRSLENLCKKENIAAIYLNPTIQNPTTQTISLHRREAIVDVALRYSVPIIEDDAYGMLPQNPITTLYNLAPDITYYITGLSKCFGAGLRTAYLYAPNKVLTQRLAGALRALSVMASPVTNALATRWTREGIIAAMTNGVRVEANIRQELAERYLSSLKFSAHSDGFHLWLSLPKNLELNPSLVAAHLRSQRVSAVSSAAFCTDNNPPNAIRLCLGGALTRWECEEMLKLVADTFEHPSHLSNVVL